MTLQITDLIDRVGRIQLRFGTSFATEITMDEARSAMEELAGILGFALVDREALDQRASQVAREFDRLARTSPTNPHLRYLQGQRDALAPLLKEV